MTVVQRFWVSIVNPTHLRSRVDEDAGLLSIEGEAPGVDEVVIGTWFHLEQMSKRRYWIRVGDTTMWVRLRKDGRVKSVSVEENEQR